MAQVPGGWASLQGDLDPTQAALLSEFLGDEGMTVERRDDPRHLGSVFGLRAQELLVAEVDLERARELLKEWSESKPDFPDDLA
jgi:Putative prokaryotic signal transducing protein